MTPKRKIPRFIEVFASRISLLILGGLTLWLGASAGRRAYQAYTLQRELARVQLEAGDLEQKNAATAILLDSFQDPKKLELEIKKRLFMKKPGEEVAVIVRDQKEELSGAQPSSRTIDATSNHREDQEAQKLSNPIKWWRYIAKRK